MENQEKPQTGQCPSRDLKWTSSKHKQEVLWLELTCLVPYLCHNKTYIPASRLVMPNTLVLKQQSHFTNL